MKRQLPFATDPLGNGRGFAAAFAVLAALLPVHAAHGEEWERADSPFMFGEAYPDVSATCETANYWIDHAPEIDGRISFAIEGELTVVEWDGALSYLIMRDEPDVEAMGVT